MPEHVWLPIDVCKLAIHQDMVKPLQVYLYLKMHTSGKCHRQSAIFKQLAEDLSIKQKRTFDKHVKTLLERNWIGYNPVSGYYFIRGFQQIMEGFRTKALAAKCERKDLRNIRKFLLGVLLSDNIRRQRTYWENKKKKNQTAAIKRVTANQPGFSSEPPSYYGISNKSIGEMLGCKQTRACILKQDAVKAGYITVNHQYKKIFTLHKPDYNIREQLYQQYPWAKGKLHFKKVKEKGKYVVHLLQQTQDEIIPHIKLGAIRLGNKKTNKHLCL